MSTEKVRGKVGRPRKVAKSTEEDNLADGVYKPSMFRHQRVKVTPEMALEWLDTMVVNRKVINSRVSQYSKDMYQGNWRDTGETIKFDTKNRLRDGQNRLWAVVEANMPVTFEVLWGVDPDAQKYTDIGVSRKPSDSLYMEGVSYSSKLSRSLSLLSLYDRGAQISLSGRPAALTTFEVVEVFKIYPDIEESAAYVFNTTVLQRLMTGSHLVFCHYVFNRIDPVACKVFWERVDQGVNLVKNDPILLLREKLITNKTASRSNKTDAVTMIALVIKAWNFYRRGRSTSRLTYSPMKETFPHAV